MSGVTRHLSGSNSCRGLSVVLTLLFPLHLLVPEKAIGAIVHSRPGGVRNPVARFRALGRRLAE